MLCKNRITRIGFLGQDAENRATPDRNDYTRLSLATRVSWKENGSNESKTRTEWHRVICWNKLAEWAGSLRKGAYVEVEGELRYREYTPAESESQNSRGRDLCEIDPGARPRCRTSQFFFSRLRSRW